MGKPRLYDEAGRFVELDERHAIAREFCGAHEAAPRLAPGRRWVHRFCGEFIAAHRTKRAATEAALKWEMERAARLERAAGI